MFQIFDCYDIALWPFSFPHRWFKFSFPNAWFSAKARSATSIETRDKRGTHKRLAYRIRFPSSLFLSIYNLYIVLFHFPVEFFFIVFFPLRLIFFLLFVLQCMIFFLTAHCSFFPRYTVPVIFLTDEYIWNDANWSCPLLSRQHRNIRPLHTYSKVRIRTMPSTELSSNRGI